MSTILIIAAHPDDEVIGAGGTIAKLVRNDYDVYGYFLGDGVSARYNDPTDAPKEEIKNRRENARKAGDILGLEELKFDNLPDNRFDSVDFLDIVKRVEDVINDIQPKIIYTHHSDDLNIDHRITSRAVVTACRPMSEQFVNEIYSFEILSSTEWSFTSQSQKFDPNVFVDIGDTFTQKVEALQAYKNEMMEFPHPRSKEGIKTLAKYRGLQSGNEKAEAFELVRKL